MTVRVLDDALVNQIAAGEVVERPASVVKELVENALDAGATTIRVTLRDGGRGLVKVTDDGHGMGRDDAILCLERHATSKIRTAQDLARVATLGFRGEALPSIAAVSRFELLTRAAGEEAGTRVRVEGGVLQGVAEAGCAPGTEIEVRSLFFNVPVRRKFLRSESTELAHCVEAVVRQAMGRPDVDFAVVHEGRDALRAPRADRVGRLRDALGVGESELFAVEFARGAYAVTGLVAPPRVNRGGHTGATYVYVNGRYVRDAVIHRALAEAYAGLLPRGRHPVVALDVRLDPERVDVNVHPSKTEVRFREPSEVQAVVAAAVRVALQAEGVRGVRRAVEGVERRVSVDQAALPLPAHPDDDPGVRGVVGERVEKGEKGEKGERPAWGVVAEGVDGVRREGRMHHGGTEARREPEEGREPEGGRAGGRRVVGVVGGRWVVVEEGEGVALVDGRAVAEGRIRDGLARDVESGEGTAVRLLAPRLVDVTRAQADGFEAARERLAAVGLDVARVGPAEVVVRGVPAALTVDPVVLVGEIAAVLGDGDRWIDVVAAHGAARAEVSEEVGPHAPAVRLTWEDLERRLRR